MRMLFVIISVLLFQNVVAYSEERPTAWIWSFECGIVLDAYDDNDEIGELIYTAVVKGIISAFNWERAKNVGKGVSNETVYYSLLKYCRDNPTSNTFFAAKEIYSILD